MVIDAGLEANVVEISRKVKDDDVCALLWSRAEEGMAFIDRDLTFRLVNRSLATQLGYTQTDMHGMILSECMASGDAETAHLEMDRVLAGESVAPQHATFVTENRSRLRGTLTMARFRDGVIVFAQIMPLPESFSRHDLPDDERTRVVIEWVWARKKRVAVALGGMLAGGNLDFWTRMLGDLAKSAGQ